MPRTQHANSTNCAISNLGAVVTRAASADFIRSGPPAYRLKAGLQTNLGSWEAVFIFGMHWDNEPRFCPKLTRNLTPTLWR